MMRKTTKSLLNTKQRVMEAIHTLHNFVPNETVYKKRLEAYRSHLTVYLITDDHRHIPAVLA